MSSRPSPAPQGPALRRSMDGIFQMWLNLRNQGHEKPLKNAFYNALVFIGIFVILGVFLVLGPFIKPLLWAGLFGAVLFPLKRRLSELLQSWLEQIEADEGSLLVNFTTAPFRLCSHVGMRIVQWLLQHVKLILGGSALIFTLKLLITFAPKSLLFQIWEGLLWGHLRFSALTGSLSLLTVLAAIGIYCLSVLVLWTPEMSRPFFVLSQILWIVVLGYLCSFLGALQIPVFIALATYGLAGLVYDARDESLINKCRAMMSYKSEATATGSRPDCESGDEPRPTTKVPEETLESDLYFRILFYACLAAILYKHTWLVVLAFIPISFYALKMLALALGISLILAEKLDGYKREFSAWIRERQDVLLPACLPGVLRLNTLVHRYACTKLKSYIDDISALFVILLLIVGVIFVSVFACIQIYSETIAVAQLGGNLINRTLTHRPDLIEMLPIDMQSMDDIIDNAHRYGRSTIENYVDQIFKDTDETQAKKLKLQILAVWDRIVQSYLDRNNGDEIGPRVPTDSIYISLGEIVGNPSAKAGLIDWVKRNVGTLVEVGDSLWMILRANMTLLLSAVGTFFSVILGGGHAVLSFLFNSIIFFTTLYYVLQSSHAKYAPLAVNLNSSWGTRLAEALESSVSSVLVATLKLALFHGVFTWLTHTTFGAHIVYLPAVLSALLAAAPFLESYWCSLPAFLDLWLSQDRFWLACLLFLVHFVVPSNFTPIIHAEIKGGGHPYLTGLSIIGGMYLLGLEGAVLGPLLLCLLVVLFDITRSTMSETPQTPHIERPTSLDSGAAEVFAINQLVEDEEDWLRRNLVAGLS